MSEVWRDVVGFFERYPYLEALAIVVGFAILARLADRLLTVTLRRLAARSETQFDDKLVDLIHRPIFTTVALVGLILATYRLDLSETLERTTVLIVQTILVIVWVLFGVRFVRLVIGTMRRSPDRFQIVQQSTEPLLSNAAAVVFFVTAVYAILVIWDINITGLVASARALLAWHSDSPPRTRCRTCSPGWPSSRTDRTRSATSSSWTLESGAKSPRSDCAPLDFSPAMTSRYRSPMV